MTRGLLFAFLPVAHDPLGSATTTIELAPSFSSHLKQNGLRVEAVPPAKARRGRFSLPLVAGRRGPTTGRGQVESEGAIVCAGARGKLPFKDLIVRANRQPLSAKVGGGQLFWAEQRLDLSAGADLVEANLQPAPPFGGKQAQGPLFTLSLQGAQTTAEPAARTAARAAASLAFTQAAADQLNQLFGPGEGAFAAGQALGSVGFTAQGQ